MTCDVVILCGGRGERLGPLTQKTPKPLLKIGKDPFLVHLLSQFQKDGFERLILAAHYMADQFQTFVKEHAALFPRLKLVVEKEPLGTGGALRHAASHVESPDFIAVNGDVFLSQSLQPVLEHHRRAASLFTMVAVRADKVEGAVANKGGLKMDEAGRLLRFQGHSREDEPWVNGGFYAVNKKRLLRWPEETYSLEKRLLSLMKPDPVNVFQSEASLLDIGTPECLAAANDKYANHSLPSC
ncbi:MAG: NTP transferase domain-containing protein [Deltaproteobacteria bacterium]|nr:NTP transferase domain-containing protein [Deltaproteobacteria bacterium]